MNPLTWVLTDPPPAAWLFAMAALALACGWWLWHSPQRRGRTVRSFLTAVALLALTCLGLPLAQRSTADRGTLLLLTDGATPALAAQALRGGPAPENMVRLNTAVELAAGQRAIDAPDLAWLLRHHGGFDRMHIVGYGLDRADLDRLGNRGVRFTSAPLPIGIAHLDVPEHIRVGDTIEIFAVVSGLSTETTTESEEDGARIVLIEPGGAVVERPVPQSGRVKLSTDARAPGRFEYQLQLLDGENNLLAEETMGLFVQAPPAVDILVLEAAPNADSRFLRDTMLASGFRFLMRTRISKDRFRWQAGNREEIEFSGLDRNLLRDFDLVIADQRVWSDLAATERRAIAAAIRQDGLGLLVKPDQLSEAGDTLLTGSELTSYLRVTALPLDDAREVSPRLIGAGRSLSRINADPFEFNPRGRQKPLIEDRMGRILAAVEQIGRGRIGSSLIYGTAAWPLRGEADHHRAYWQHLVDHLAKPQTPPARWHLADRAPPTAHRPLLIQLTTGTPSPRPAIAITAPDGVRTTLAPAQGVRQANRWHARTWPRQPGWHTLTANDANRSDIYIAPADAWPVARAAMRIQQTAARIATANQTTATTHTNKPLPKWPFALFLVGALATLWHLRKRTRS